MQSEDGMPKPPGPWSQRGKLSSCPKSTKNSVFAASLLKRFRKFHLSNRQKAFAAWLLFCALAIAFTSLYPNWNLVRARNTNKAVVKQIGLAGYAWYDSFATLKSWLDERRLSVTDASEYVSFLEQVREARGIQTATQTRKNVVYLQMESVDGISVTADHNGEPVMPFLKELSQSTLYFKNALDNTSAGRTTDGEFLVLCSLPPVARKPVFNNYTLDKIPSMPRVLGREGYQTFSMHGNEGNFWNRANAHRALGYQESLYQNNLDQRERIGWGITDESVLSQAAIKIASATESVFAHIILLTNHHPYNHVGEKFGYAKNDIPLDHIDSLRYVDQSIKKFFTALEAYGVLENSIIVIYSDHDSATELKLRPIYTLPDPPIANDTIPLLIYGLQQEPRVIDKVSGLQDVPVIVLEELGIEIPHTFVGNSIQSDLPTLTPNGFWASKRNGELVKPKAPIEPSTLTKLAILHPDKLEPESP